jgi:hypothetical protein
MESTDVILDESLVNRNLKARELYETPEFNQCLMMHRLSISHIGNISAYVNVTSLFLEHNRLDSLTGLNQLPKLKYLNANANLIKTLDLTQLDLPELEELHVAGNHISDIIPPERDVERLRAIRLSRNRLTRLPPLNFLPSLQILDISQNPINALSTDEYKTYLLSLSPTLAQLYIAPSDLTNQIPLFRKVTITTLPRLVFFDERPVTPDEIELAAAELSGDSERIKSVKTMQKQRAHKEVRDRIKTYGEYEKTNQKNLRDELRDFVKQFN